MVLMATPQGRSLGYHTPEQVSNQEPRDSCHFVLTTTLLGGALYVRLITSYIYYNSGNHDSLHQSSNFAAWESLPHHETRQQRPSLEVSSISLAPLAAPCWATWQLEVTTIGSTLRYQNAPLPRQCNVVFQPVESTGSSPVPSNKP